LKEGVFVKFQQDVIDAAWKKAGGKCGCQRTSHYYHRDGICGQVLVLESKSISSGRGAWEAHYRDSNHENGAASNCEILCWDCHKQTI
jgi:hypothetical protein